MHSCIYYQHDSLGPRLHSPSSLRTPDHFKATGLPVRPNTSSFPFTSLLGQLAYMKPTRSLGNNVPKLFFNGMWHHVLNLTRNPSLCVVVKCNPTRASKASKLQGKVAVMNVLQLIKLCPSADTFWIFITSFLQFSKLSLLLEDTQSSLIQRLSQDLLHAIPSA